LRTAVGYNGYSRFQKEPGSEEPADESWVPDWAVWASAYKLWLKRPEQE
jgi:hypothetical protein